MTPQELQQQLSHVNPEKLEAYMKMYDRILLYTIASNIMSRESIGQTIHMWDQVIKKGIDIDATQRTNFLESTPPGRMSKIKKEHDGEDIRLEGLNTWIVARNLISANISRDHNDMEM